VKPALLSSNPTVIKSDTSWDSSYRNHGKRLEELAAAKERIRVRDSRGMLIHTSILSRNGPVIQMVNTGSLADSGGGAQDKIPHLGAVSSITHQTKTTTLRNTRELHGLRQALENTMREAGDTYPVRKRESITEIDMKDGDSEFGKGDVDSRFPEA
jgi:hypothetical protein